MPKGKFYRIEVIVSKELSGQKGIQIKIKQLLTCTKIQIMWISTWEKSYWSLCRLWYLGTSEHSL